MAIPKELLEAKIEWTPPPVQERAKKVVEYFYKADFTPSHRTLVISVEYREMLCDLILELVAKIDNG